MSGINNHPVMRISREAELTLLNELKELFATNVNVTLAALHEVALKMKFRVVNDSLAYFIKMVGVEGKIETHRSKVSRILSKYTLRKPFEKEHEVEKRVAKMKSFIRDYYPEYAQLLGES